MMSTTTAKEEAITSFPGLRPLEPSKAPAFWDAINFKIGTSALNPPDEDDYGSARANNITDWELLSENVTDKTKGSGIAVAYNNTLDFGSSRSPSEERDDGMILTNSNMIAERGVVNMHSAFGNPDVGKIIIPATTLKQSIVPHSFPKPDPSCFVKYYAPLEPLILLPNNFSTTPESLEKLSVSIEDYLKSRDDVAFSSSGSSWSGSILRTSCHCAFRFCVYRSRKVENLYIIEGQRVEGDGFLFGGLYQGVKARISREEQSSSSSLSSAESRSSSADEKTTAENSRSSSLEVDNMEIEDDGNVENSGDTKIDDNDLRNFALNVKEMVNSEDSQVALNGIQFAGEMCTDKTMVKFMYTFDLVQDLYSVIKQRNVGFLHEKKWHCQHALIALSHLAHTQKFKSYISEKMVGQRNLSSLLLVELDGIQLETDGFDGNSAAKIHMIKYSNSIRQKITA